MFDNDLDQSVLVLVLPLLALAALPFFMAWLEDALDGAPAARGRSRWASVRATMSPRWTAMCRLVAALRRRRSARTSR